jgi:ribosome-associated translation inhibitor RaiA
MLKRPIDVQVVARDAQIGPAVKAYAQKKLAALARIAPGSVLNARVTLARSADPAVTRPVDAEAVLDLNGTPIHARVSSRRLNEAVDLLEARLRHRLEHLASRRRTLHRSSGVAAPGEWRHGHLLPQRPGERIRAAENRQVVARTTFARQPLSIEEASGELALLDYRFHLFTETSTGQDALLWRTPAGRFCLSMAGPLAPDLSGCAIPAEVQPPATSRSQDQALALLELTDAPFVFFVDTATGRGTVAHRRLDGSHGLLLPPVQP